MTRWLVELKSEQFDDVGTAYCHVAHGGTLVFHDGDPLTPVLVYAPGTWLSVCEGAE